ncbi:hypothetical protein RSOLAG1IB_04305 [Rhizoctonia solani AG-1 IB]|uniref:Uncharacterized protein n=1 Tax=Thanatephorus cucumeris (strain AG1-IB / isolate 7/3/14) TaxID=1108050 RepID=A0A0B7FTQ5_THACB|nr:hypothetical protein RSOLAG1IB_04305 [Rhizoctonia solani AG-1 IB]
MPGLNLVPVQPRTSSAPLPRSQDHQQERDPHALPSYTNESFNEPQEPVLFLPPLLSALPASLSSRAKHHDRSKLTELPKLPPHPDRLGPTATRLPDIDPASLSLHRALHFLKSRKGFAKLPYDEVFNWDEISAAYHSDLDKIPDGELEREWYVVAFRSKRKAGSDSAALYDADRLAHEEAIQNGGLIMYWYGVPEESGDNLATCIWQSRAHAIAANSGPHHIKAMRLAASSFEYYTFEKFILRKWKGVTDLELTPYTEGPVGW